MKESVDYIMAKIKQIGASAYEVSAETKDVLVWLECQENKSHPTYLNTPYNLVQGERLQYENEKTKGYNIKNLKQFSEVEETPTSVEKSGKQFQAITTAKRMGEQHGVDEKSIRDNGKYANVVDEITELVGVEAKNKILTGEKKISKENMIELVSNKESNQLKDVRKLLKEINGKVFHWDDFCDGDIGEGYQDEDGIGHFGETLNVGKYIFKLKSSTDTMFEKDTILSKAFKGFSGFTFCVYECETKFSPSEHDFEPSITALQADDRIFIVGYSEGFEV